MKYDLSSTKEREKADLLTVVAYGAHDIALEAVRNILEGKGILNFRLYEFFASPPIPKGKSPEEMKAKVHAPFLRRIAEKESEIIPDNKKIEKVINAHNLSPEQKSNLIAPRSSFLLKEYFDFGMEFRFNKRVTPQGYDLFTKWEKGEKVIEEQGLNYGLWKKEYLKEYFSKTLDLKVDGIGVKKNDKIGRLMEYFLCDYIYENSKLGKVGWVAVPVASTKVFYGYIFSIIPTDEVDVLRKVEKELGKRSKDYFLPMLVLFENHWEEKILSEEQGGWEDDDIVLKEKENQPYRVPIIFLHTKGSGEVLERKLYKLWGEKRRKDKAKGNIDEEWKEKNLLFSNFIIASPKMIKKIRDKIVQLNPQKRGKKLPTVLVIGGPGSGKDTIAKMIPLFSDNYYECERYPINLASLKPPQIAPSLLMGLDIDVGGKKLPSLSLEGMFWRIIEIKKKKKENKRKKEIPAVIILDELNSLDIDTQGVLLRFIEESELVPIGGIETDKIKADFLLIGEMNEDPERLTKESFLQQSIREGKGTSFGGVIGEILYEYFRKIRRLREDLYHRFIRGGKIILPSLEERKEDIPILFYLFCKDELKEKEKDENKKREKSLPKRLYIPFEIFDIVTNLDWPGNVRQLQTLAPIVMRYAEADFKNMDEKALTITIRKSHVYEALKEIGQEIPPKLKVFEREEGGR